MPTRWTPSELDEFVLGLRLLGSGGGGDPHLLALSTATVLLERPVDWVTLDDLPDDGWVAPVAYIGATAAIREKLPAGTELVAAVEALTRWTGVRPVAVMAVEMAGVNGIAALDTAARGGLPLLDADFTGRALPRLDQLSVCVAGGRPTPCVVTEAGGTTVLVDGTDAHRTETLIRTVITATGGWAALAFAFQRVAALGAVAITGTAARARHLGRAMATADHLHEIDEVTVLADGRISAIDAAPERDGSRRTSVTITDSASGAVLRVEADNEFVLVLRDGDIVCAAPDIICLIAAADRQVLSIDDVRAGTRVSLLHLPAPAWWRARR